jgi:D-3-phosphoglycerate dehydrogenase
VLRAELLARYENVTFNDAGAELRGQSLVDFLRGHDRAITALEVLDADVLAQLPELGIVSKYGVGLDMIDLHAMREHGKQLGWTGGVNRRSVTELALSMMIALLRHVPEANGEVRSGTWRQHVGGQLTGRCVGIVGCGHVGKDLVLLLEPFRCRVLAHDIRDYADFYTTHGVHPVDLDTLLAEADVVSVHVPLDASTRNLLDRARLSRMKSSAVLVNTARGGIVDETAVHNMLREKRLAGAGFDVFAQEPPTNTDLIAMPNFLATPHIGGSAAEAILAMGRAAIDGLDECRVPELDVG